MAIFDFLKPKKNTASVAKNRLQIIIAQERSNDGAPDYLPLMRREILEVIRKYVSVEADAVKVDVVKDGEHDVLDISVALPEARADTPVHSLLHEAGHLIVLPPERRAGVHTDATDSIAEEDAVCVLQALLATK